MLRTVSQPFSRSIMPSKASPKTWGSMTAPSLSTIAARASVRKHRSANQVCPTV